MNKFRAWNKNRNTWEEKLCIYIDDGKIGDVSECFHNIEDENNYIVQQSSSLLAKSGEIYEGDIVRFVSKDDLGEIIFQDIGIVKYHNAAFIVDGEPFGKDDHYLGDYVVEGNTTELEIIGNVLENPEILENSKK
jgi:uncharacterized phage protein (TIGR01671 family)